MKTFLVLVFSLLFLTPSYATAAEPTNGTIIMLGSIGGWMILSLFLVSRKKDAEQKNSESKD